MGYEIRYYAPGEMSYGFCVSLQYFADEQIANNAARELLDLHYEPRWEIENDDWAHSQYGGVAVHRIRTENGYRLNAFGYGTQALCGNAAFRVAEIYPGGELLPSEGSTDYRAA